MKRGKKGASVSTGNETEGQTLTTPEEIERSPAGIVRRWCSELALAHAAEKDWRKEGEDVWKLYEGENARANSFTILWSNTETLRPALYNSTPTPDVRRRYRDADPLGKATSQVLERALAYEVDDYDFDTVMQDSVLDMLLPGRGVARIKYEPKFAAQESPLSRAASGSPEGEVQPEAETQGNPPTLPGAPQAPDALPLVEQEDEPGEKLVDELVECEHVQWTDFRRGPGKRWKDVPWIAFRHEFTYDMAEDKFGQDIAKALTYEDTENAEEVTDKQAKELFRVAIVWEIWDKDERRVLFIAPAYKAQPCLMVPDPLKLKGFWPMPRPMYAIENSRSLVPTPLYRMYKQQALELDRISARINKVAAAIKVRGAYHAGIEEMGRIIDADDGEMVPISNASAVATIGLDNSIWMLPVEKLGQVLQALYQAREQIKQTIYEITGISDIVRGATNASETATAQRIKSQWGSLRLQKMQREVQRFARDLMRLTAEVVSERFAPETLASITNVQLPDAAAKQQAKAAMQQAQVNGQPPPPEAQDVLSKPSWDDVMSILRSDQLRSYRVDIETDSTVAEMVDRDMQGLSEVTTALGGLIAGAAPAVQAGMLPVDAVKAIALAITRRARLGTPVEDALEEIQAPPQPQQVPPTEQELQKIADAKEQLVAAATQHVEKVQSLNQEAAMRDQQVAGAADAVQQVGQAVVQTTQQAAMQTTQQVAAVEQTVAQQLAQAQQFMGALVQAIQQMSANQQAAVDAQAQAAQQSQAAAEQLQGAMAQLAEIVSRPKKVAIKSSRGTTYEAETMQ